MTFNFGFVEFSRLHLQMNKNHRTITKILSGKFTGQTLVNTF